MKTLKLDHNLAILVGKGEKTSTRRMYDDKNLSVNDDVQLIDKVDPNNPATWRPIGIVRINTVIQKRLGDLDASDFERHEPVLTGSRLLEYYQKIYGTQVTLDTPIKIVRFIFNNYSRTLSDSVVDMSPILTDIKLYCDGGSRGNPGPSASGFVIMNMHNDIVVKKAIYLGVTTNNQAEYQALNLGLEEAIRMQAKEVQVYMDSLLVVNQMLGIFKVKNRDLWPIHDAIKGILPKFERVSFTHVPRELNKIADSAVNEALDEAAHG